MSSLKAETFTPLNADEIVPGDPITTIWRWCVANKWTFIPSFTGGEPLIDIRCAWQIASPDTAFSTAKNGILAGVKRHSGGTVKLSDVVALKEDMTV